MLKICIRRKGYENQMSKLSLLMKEKMSKLTYPALQYYLITIHVIDSKVCIK